MDSSMDIKFSKDNLEFIIAASYFFDKLKRYFTKEKIYLRGNIGKRSDLELFKAVSSATFCIAKFNLASKGIFVFKKEEILKEYRTKKDAFNTLNELYLARKKNKITNNLMDNCFLLSQKLYEELLAQYYGK